MANYFLHVKIFSRGKGSNAIKAAAYRAGERIRDDGTSVVYNYLRREDVAHAEIVLPAGYAGSAEMQWALDRKRLWNASQHADRRRNARTAREVLVHVPPEMTAAQRAALVRGFAQELATRYGAAVDFAVHVPRPGADERHHHAHLLMTCRKVGPAGIGARTELELSGTERHDRGLGPSKGELLWLRERWSVVTNDALREAGLSARVDHRSYRDQGIDREPVPMMPRSIYYSERRSGRNSPAGDDIRARYRERVEARREGPEALAGVVLRQKQENRIRAVESARHKAALPRKIPQGALTREERNQKRRELDRPRREEINRRLRERRRLSKSETPDSKEKTKAAGLRRRDAGSSGARATQPAGAAAAVDRSTRAASPEAAAKNWLALRESQKPAPTEDSARRWLAYRTSASARAADATSPSQRVEDVDRQFERATGKRAVSREQGGKDEGKKPGRDRKPDASL